MQHISVEKVVGAVSIEKDVDGFHPMNVGRLAMQGRAPRFVSCTPKACIELLLRSGVEMDGKHAVVLGRSNVVGMPAALLLQVCFVLWNLILIISLIILYLRLYRLSLIY
jgi:5,10-methylene-tetrahydrofolate dehydrogenase/methenyl tetrahydrofolate cyclohydrolase